MMENEKQRAVHATDTDGKNISPTESSETKRNSPKVTMTKDEYHLATLGYEQTFIRSLGMLENWASTFTTMNFVNGIPVLFGYAMVCRIYVRSLCQKS